MYDLPYHKEKDEQVIKEFIGAHPFAFMTGCDEQGRPVATQVPVSMEERDGRRVLSGHIMKKTDHHKAFQYNDHVLVVFTGDHAYVSARWYSDPHIASTWNYMSVHAHGRIRFLDDAGLEEVLRKMTLHFEDHDEGSPTVFHNLPEGFKNEVMDAIVGFEIEVTKIDSVFKLSQDQDFESYLNIIKELKKRDGGGRGIAAEMEKRAKEVFPGER